MGLQEKEGQHRDYLLCPLFVLRSGRCSWIGLQEDEHRDYVLCPLLVLRPRSCSGLGLQEKTELWTTFSVHCKFSGLSESSWITRQNCLLLQPPMILELSKILDQETRISSANIGTGSFKCVLQRVGWKIAPEPWQRR